MSMTTEARREYQRRYRVEHPSPSAGQRRKPKPSRAADPILRQIFDTADAAGMTLTSLALDMGTAPAVIWKYRTGRQCPDIMRAAQLARCAGLRLGLLPDDGGPNNG